MTQPFRIGLSWPRRQRLISLKPTEDDLLKYLEWNDTELAGTGFEPWRPFDHDQLGRVEIGGWKFMYTLRNPPAKYLAEVCHNTCLFSLDHARCTPVPRLSLAATELSPELWRVTATMRNEGFLPTYVTERAQRANLVNPLHLELEVEGLTLEEGKRHERVEHLEGMANSTFPAWPAHTHHGRTRATIEERSWILRGSGLVRVSWWGDRIGRHIDELDLGGSS